MKAGIDVRYALVTGSSSGIGRAVALALAGEGFGVLFNGTRPERAVRAVLKEAEAKNKIPGSCAYLRGDISRAVVRRRIVSYIERNCGRLSALVNNAGITTEGRRDMLELTENNIKRVFDVNLIGPFLLSSALSRFLMDNGSTSYIINISSISAETVSINRADYCMSKAGMSMMTSLFAARLASHGVRVFELRPGIVRTPMTEPVSGKYDRAIEEGLLPIRRWGEPEDVSSAVRAIVRGHLDYSTGETLHIDGGFHLKRL
jgi:NAD(P)-dependent dehydrogenase (short-subunit alcohol dehydrogenase family)